MLIAGHRLIAFIVVTVLILFLCIAWATTGRRNTINVLFIGNSYTFVNEMPSTLEQLSDDSNQPIHCTMAVEGGATLETHWNNPNTRQALKSRKWDLIVLQEQSMQPIGNPASFGQYGGLLADEAKASGAKVLFYMTWARQGSPEQQADLTNAYRSVAAKNSCAIAPVGEAWRIVREQRPNIVLFADDGSHPSPVGSYLAACVFYGAITGKSPVGLHYPEGMTSDDASFLQSSAWQAVRQEQ